MSSDGRIAFTLDDGRTFNVRIGGGHMSEPTTTWRVERLDAIGLWRKCGTRDDKIKAVQLRDALVDDWTSNIATRIIRIETREFVEEER